MAGIDKDLALGAYEMAGMKAFEAGAALVGVVVKRFLPLVRDAIADAGLPDADARAERYIRVSIGYAFLELAASQLRGRIDRDAAIEEWRKSLDDEPEAP